MNFIEKPIRNDYIKACKTKNNTVSQLIYNSIMLYSAIPVHPITSLSKNTTKLCPGVIYESFILEGESQCLYDLVQGTLSPEL